MSETIITAIIGLIGSGLGAFGGVVASARLTQYRLKRLEEKVQAHNNLIERTFRLEGRMTEAEHDIRDLKQRER